MGSALEPDFSVVIPAFNAERFIEQSIGSALTQSTVSLEVIVIDDASDDDTTLIACHLARDNSRLRVHRNERNMGPASSRNRGIGDARGRWTALLDADDYFAPDRLQRLLRVAEDEEADLLADNVTIVSEKGHRSEPPSTRKRWGSSRSTGFSGSIGLSARRQARTREAHHASRLHRSSWSPLSG